MHSVADRIAMSDTKHFNRISLTDKPLKIDGRHPVVTRSRFNEADFKPAIVNMFNYVDSPKAYIENEEGCCCQNGIDGFICKHINRLPISLVAWRAEPGNSAILYWHDFCQRLFGWSREEMMERNFLELLTDREDRDTIEMVVERIGPKFLPSIMVNTCCTKSGEEIRIKWCHTPIFDESTGFFHIFSLAQQLYGDVLSVSERRGCSKTDNLEIQESVSQESENKIDSDQSDQELSSTIERIRSNVDMIVAPILRSIAIKSGEPEEKYMMLLNEAVGDLANSFITRLGTDFLQLTPRDLEVCNMIRAGLSSKDIARVLHVTEHTVVTKRKRIRRKLGIAHAEIDLLSFLRSY